MTIDKNTTFAEFCYYMDVFDVSGDKFESMLNELKSYPVPEMFNKSLGELKFRQLNDLQESIKDFNDLLFDSFEIIYYASKEYVMTLPAFDCLRFALFVKDELEYISKLFKEIEYKPTPEEQRAGINNTSSGFFGLIDWYARRMGITNHDRVVELQWLTIYKCLKMDFDKNMFERRYRTNQELKNKR